MGRTHKKWNLIVLSHIELVDSQNVLALLNAEPAIRLSLFPLPYLEDIAKPRRRFDS